MTQILLLDPSARAGRTGYCLKVKDANRIRMEVRHWVGNSRENTPSTAEILAAAKRLSALLYDATHA